MALLPVSKLLPVIVLSLLNLFVGLGSMLSALLNKGPGRYFDWKERKERPAIMTDPSLGEHKTVQLESIKLHYVEKGDRDKPLMLFLHGFPECWFSWRHQIRHFSAHYRTVAVDMRGYGESEKPGSIAEYTPEKLIEDVRQLIIALGQKKCILVAHDWGGAIAIRFAEEHPTMLDRLILVNIPHYRAFEKHLQSNLSQLWKSWYMFFFQWPLLGELLLRSDDYAFISDVYSKRLLGSSRSPCSPEEVDAYKYSLGQPGGLTCPINYYRAALRFQTTLLPKTISEVWTHMIWGEQDMALEKQMAEKSKEFISGLGISYIPTAGHWSLMEEPELVNDAMDEFLSRKKGN